MNLKDIFEARRSINFFDKSKELDISTLKKIIDLAVLAPSAFNLQPWRIIAVKSVEAKEKLYKNAEQPKIKEASVNLIIIGDRGGYKDRNPMWDEIQKVAGDERIQSAKQAANYLYGTTEDRSIKFAESNAGLLAMSIMYAAKYHGVESHAMSGINFSGIKQDFKLNEDEEVVMVIALGYFDESKKLYPQGYRRGYEEIVNVL